jgi:hypothetical protein
VPTGLAALDSRRGARGRARPARVRSGPGAVPGGQVDPAQVGLGGSAQGPQGGDRGDRGRPQVALRRDRERGLRRRGGRSPHRRIAADHAREEKLGLKFGRPATARVEPAAEVEPEDRDRPNQSEEDAA